MLEHQPEKAVDLAHDDARVEVSTPSGIISMALDVLLSIKEMGSVLDEHVLFYWAEAIKFAETTGERIFDNQKAVAAAIDHLARKQKGRSTQKSVAEQYEITVSVLSLRIKKLIGWVNRNV
ncbi:hypothetical protein P4V41_02230 [Fictibacillus nanhaiensis]|uniref:hypothetical protein n=1 Tax=Fictibacillus nanhaiensis TaxID=742169 RepID=UPI002E1AB6EC|nr:hypothetical protein [Fictibacillus nanhaiensis]